MKTKNILYTGEPGCGKSTLVERLLLRLDRPATGFFTREIREKGSRKGFLIETLDGKRGILARTAGAGAEDRGPGAAASGTGGRALEEALNAPAVGPRVGRYIVNLADIERVAVPSMAPTRPGEVVVIDEIGKMECLSPAFRRALVAALDSDHPVLATAALRGTPFIEEVKARADVLLILVDRRNRDLLAAHIPLL